MKFGILGSWKASVSVDVEGKKESRKVGTAAVYNYLLFVSVVVAEDESVNIGGKLQVGSVKVVQAI